MNLRWLIWDYVDPSVEIDSTTRRHVRAQARRDFRANRTTALAGRRPITGLEILHALIPAGIMAGVFLGVTRTNAPLWVIIPMILVQVLVSLALMGLVAGFMLRPHVYRILRERGYDVCLVCGYRLDGLAPSTVQCPECGTATEHADERRIVS